MSADVLDAGGAPAPRYGACVAPAWDVEAWRAALGAALKAGLPPDAVDWRDLDWRGLDATGGGEAGRGDGATLFAAPDVSTAPPRRRALSLPRHFVERAATALCHVDPARLPLLHRIGWRIASGERGLLGDPLDPDAIALDRLERDVRRDAHKMTAFVRFVERAPGSDDFVAWFEPQHRIVDRVAPFFRKRFAGMRWAIFTPYRSVAWDGTALAFGPGTARAALPPTARDDGEALWRTYYANIFNPARVNPEAMQREMPKKYWAHLPEAALIPQLVRDAPARAAAMQAALPTAPHRATAARARHAGLARGHGGGADDAVEAPQPGIDRASAGAGARPGIAALRAEAAACRDCALWQPATQTVFGEGPAGAPLMLVGEAPGDREDLVGRPFVGPAGQLLDRALAAAGLDRGALYVTSAVKHFHYERSGRVRLHRKPRAGHVQACRPWLAKELEAVGPRVVVCLGGTAAQAVLGEAVQTLVARGSVRTLDNGAEVLITVHPAWVLRQPAGEAQAQAFAMLVGDLQLARNRVGTERG